MSEEKKSAEKKSAEKKSAAETSVVETSAAVKKIPKCVHQIWFGGENIPKWRTFLFNYNSSICKKMGYEHKLWTDSTRTQKNFPKTFQYQELALAKGQDTGQSRWAQVADLARLEIINELGGIYIDSLFQISETFLKRMNFLLEKRFLLIGANEDPCGLKCNSNGKQYLTNSFFAAPPNSEVLETLLSEEYLDGIDFESELINRTTGPYFLRSGITQDHIDDEVIFLFKTNQIYPFNVNTSKYRQTAQPNYCIKNTKHLTTSEKNDYVYVDENKSLYKDCFSKIAENRRMNMSKKQMLQNEIRTKLKTIMKVFFIFCKNEMKELLKNKQNLDAMKKNKTDYTTNIKESMNHQNEINNAFKAKLNKKISENLSIVSHIQGISNLNETEIQNMSMNQILHKIFRFVEPIKFGEMIKNWKQSCRKNNCNYLVVEYPEFAEPGGYQMAINAKPLFIKKALELCGGRSVLYIDGDMCIKKYPHIFDMPDVDFMARGWWMDPRANDGLDESFVVDPYLFETSGGTMYFSNSMEAYFLLKLWIEESAKEKNKGKADDRILSLVFAIRKLLFSMKIIQLPIEYLWLSLSYDDYMPDKYFNNKNMMKETIFIEHPECLTSEDTATSSGASNDRLPNTYRAIEEYVYPISEEFHEYVFFPNTLMRDQFKDYLNYMKKTQYIYDGNKFLIEQKFIFKEDKTKNEYPLYVTPFENNFGKRNDVAKKNKNIIDKNKWWFDTNVIQDDIVLINEDLNDEDDLIPFIIKLLSENKSVFYNPSNMDGHNPFYKKIFDEKYEFYKNFEFVYVGMDHFTTSNYDMISNDFKRGIQINQPIFFRPNDVLIKFLYMFKYLSDLSEMLDYGYYHFISRVRITFLEHKKTEFKKIRELYSTENQNEFLQYKNKSIISYSKLLSHSKKILKKTKRRRSKTRRSKTKRLKTKKTKHLKTKHSKTRRLKIKRVKTRHSKTRRSKKNKRRSVTVV